VPARFLPIYLNDHLAGATLGIELARRTRGENEGSDLGVFLEGLLPELLTDRESLLRLMRSLGIAPSLPKSALAWTGEKLGRLKLNGQLSGYSPLSRLVELEGLASGVEAKHAMWVAVERISDRDARLAAFPYGDLQARARSQRERLEPFRLAAAETAFG
jgi:hypothetical protein